MWWLWLLGQLQVAPVVDVVVGPAPDPRLVIDDTITTEYDFVIAVVGDINIARNANASLRQSGDFDAPFLAAAPILTEAALAFGNLESPLFPTCKTLTYSMQFCGDERGAQALATMGIDVVTTVNNHQNDHGRQGRIDTRTTLEAAGIVVNDAYNVPVIVETHGKKIGFLGFNAIGSGPGWRRHWVKAIADLKPFVDIVIVMPHWGREYAALPRDNPSHGVLDKPRQLAKVLVAAGADLVVGNHPHVLQGLELINGVPVMYSHGNFFFDQRGLDQRQTVIGLYAFAGSAVVDIAFIPFEQRGMTLVRLEGDEKAAVVAKLQQRSPWLP
jgi:hypothetical protein